MCTVCKLPSTPVLLRPALLLKLHGLPSHLWIPTLYAEQLRDPEACTDDEVASFEVLSDKERADVVKTATGGLPAITTDQAPINRRKGQPRPKRVMRRGMIPGLRFVRRHALDPFLDSRLSPGARTTLVYLIARCGKGRAFRKRTCLVANDRRISQRTLQTHYVALETAGYITRSAPDRMTGETTILLLSTCEPPPFRSKAIDPEGASSGAGGAQDSAPTHPIKDSKTGESLEPVNREGAECALPESAGPSSQEPGAELPRPAQPRARVLGIEEVLVAAMRSTRESHAGDRIEGLPGLTRFDSHMNAILVRVMGKAVPREDHRSSTDPDLESGEERRPPAAGNGTPGTALPSPGALGVPEPRAKGQRGSPALRLSHLNLASLSAARRTSPGAGSAPGTSAAGRGGR